MLKMVTDNDVNVEQSDMKPDQFTKFMAIPSGAGYTPPLRGFYVTREFITNIRKEITGSQIGKAEDRDGQFIEEMKLDPTKLCKTVESFLEKIRKDRIDSRGMANSCTNLHLRKRG